MYGIIAAVLVLILQYSCITVLYDHGIFSMKRGVALMCSLRGVMT